MWGAPAPASARADGGRGRVDLFGDPLPAKALARLGTVRFRHQGYGLVGLAAVNNQVLVSVGEDGRVCWWDIQTGRPLHSLRVAGLQLRGCALSGDGTRLAVGGSFKAENTAPPEYVVRVLDAASGKTVREFNRGKEDVLGRGLTLTPDGKLLSLSHSGILRLEEVATGIELLRESFALARPAGLTLSADGKVVAVYGRKVHVWEWQSGNPPREVPHGWYGAQSASLSPDGKTLVTDAHGADGLRLWDAGSGKLLRTVPGSNSRYWQRLAISPDGRHLVSASYRETPLTLRDFSTLKKVRRWDPPGDSRFAHLAFTPDSRRLAVSLSENALAVWDLTTGEVAASPQGHHNAPSFVALLAGGTAITAGDDGTARLWDARTGKPGHELRVANHWLRGAAVSPDGKWLATSQQGETPAVRLWDVASGKQIHRLAGHGSLGGLRALRFTPDGKHLLSWGDDMDLRRWDVRAGTLVAEHAIRPVSPAADKNAEPATTWEMAGRLDGALITADGSRLVFSSHQGVQVFDSATGKQVGWFDHDSGHTEGLASSPDGRRLLLSGWGKPRRVVLPAGRIVNRSGPPVVSVRELATGRLVWRREVEGVADRMGGVAFSPDGRTYAVGVGSVPARIEFGEAATGKVTATLRDVPGRVESLAFSPDGTRLIAGLRDTTALIWPVPGSGP